MRNNTVGSAVRLVANQFGPSPNASASPTMICWARPVMAAIQPRVDRLIWPGPAPSTVESSGTTAFQNVFQNGMSIDKALKEAQGQMDTDMKSSDFTSMESKYAYFDEHK